MSSTRIIRSETHSPAWWPALGGAALLAATPLAFAQAAGGNWHAKQHSDTQARAHALSQARVSMSQAIQTAQRDSNGKAVYARFELRDGKPVWLVRTAAMGQEWDGVINASTGQLQGKAMKLPDSRLNPIHRKEVTAAGSVQTSLVKAIDDAEHQGGKPLQANLVLNRKGQPGYDVQLVKRGAVHTAMINAQTGKLE